MELSGDQHKFLKCLEEEYSCVADTGNLEWSLEWTPRKIGAVGRSLQKLKFLKITKGAGSTMNSNREGTGSVYQLLRNERN